MPKRMRRGLRWLGFALGGSAVVLMVLLLASGASLRAKRHEAGVPLRITERVSQVRNFLADVYAARLGERVILFDAGMDPDGHALELLTRALGRDVTAVHDLFLTHAHFDHVAGAGLFRKARIYIGAGDAEVLAHRASARAVVPWLFGMLLGVSSIEASHRLSEATEIDVGNGYSVLALPFPGHTPGSFVYLFDGVLFTGDSLLVKSDMLAVASPDQSVDPTLDCQNVARLATIVAAGRVSRICTGHMGCLPEHETRSLLAELTTSAAKRCPAAVAR